MKLPFELGAKLFFRMLLPGLFLAGATWPVLFPLVDALAFPNRHELAFVGVAVLGGWLIVLLDMPIYMLFEGRRGWPERARLAMIAREQKRLAGLEKIIDEWQEPADPRRYEEASVDARQFPFDGGRRIAKFPTRLGNLITSFEEYSETRYGLDAIFFWPRIWIQLPKDTREDLDNSQSMADSALYCCFALSIAAILWLLYAALQVAGVHKVQTRMPTAGVVVTATLCIVGALVLYRIALFVNVQFGELFKAVCDVYGSSPEKLDQQVLNTAGVLSIVSAWRGVPPPRVTSQIDRLQTVWMYLQNFRVRCPVCNEPVRAPLLQEHVGTHWTSHPQPRARTLAGSGAPVPSDT